MSILCYLPHPTTTTLARIDSANGFQAPFTFPSPPHHISYPYILSLLCLLSECGQPPLRQRTQSETDLEASIASVPQQSRSGLAQIATNLENCAEVPPPNFLNDREFFFRAAIFEQCQDLWRWLAHNVIATHDRSAHKVFLRSGDHPAGLVLRAGAITAAAKAIAQPQHLLCGDKRGSRHVYLRGKPFNATSEDVDLQRGHTDKCNLYILALVFYFLKKRGTLQGFPEGYVI